MVTISVVEGKVRKKMKKGRSHSSNQIAGAGLNDFQSRHEVPIYHMISRIRGVLLRSAYILTTHLSIILEFSQSSATT
jgi:hypothetical protein